MAATKFALITNGEVTNVIMLDETDSYQVPDGMSLLQTPEEVSLGWTVSNGQFVAPPPDPVPVTPTEDPAVTAAKESAYQQLTGLGISDANARLIVGLPPAS